MRALRLSKLQMSVSRMCEYFHVNVPMSAIFFLDSAEYFRYTNQGQNINIPCVEDAVEMEHTRNALTVLGKTSKQFLYTSFYSLL